MAAKYNITLDAGSDFTLHLSLKTQTGEVISLIGASARMQVKCKYSEDFFFDELTTSNGRIVIDEDMLTLTFPHDVTEKYEKHSGVYDIKLTQSDGSVIRILEGRLNVYPSVTR
jgi:ABC-type histidine transport system ATPase subunit